MQSVSDMLQLVVDSRRSLHRRKRQADEAYRTLKPQQGALIVPA